MVTLESEISSKTVSFEICHIQRLLNLFETLSAFTDSETYVSFPGMRIYYAVNKTWLDIAEANNVLCWK